MPVTQQAIPLCQPSVLTASLESDAPPFTPWFHLEWEPDSDLRFSVGCCKNPYNSIAEGQPITFTQELWKQDVGELFIKHAKTDAYLEINLAPFGAWWACLFSGYRKPSTSAATEPFKAIQLDTQTTADAWETSLSVPKQFLAKHLGFGPGNVANVCFILGEPSQRHHFSYAPMPHDPPDYHHVADFVAMRSPS